MLGETIPRNGHSKWTAPLLVALILGFVALLSLPHAFDKDESAIDMALTPSGMKASAQPAMAWQTKQPMNSMQPFQAGQYMQQVRRPVQVSALTSPDQLDAESPLAKQRRNMLAASFGLAAASLSGGAWAADTGAAAVFDGKPVDKNQVDPPKKKAEDYAGSYNSVQTVAKPSTKTTAATVKPGSVGDATAFLPALAVGSVLLAGVPVLLSPGEKAFQAQRASESGQRVTLKKNRKQIQQAPKRQAWWGQKSAAKAETPKKSGFFR